MSDNARLNLVVSGLVQGVFFRASTLEQAQGLGLLGWVKNLPDGRVEVLAEGPRWALEKLAQWCGHGPKGARVDDVALRWEEPTGEFRTFMITR